MPLYNFDCLKCNNNYKKILKVEQSTDIQLCKVCKEPLARNPIPPASRVTEIIDTGSMNKRLELLTDQSRLMKERSKEKKAL